MLLAYWGRICTHYPFPPFPPVRLLNCLSRKWVMSRPRPDLARNLTFFLTDGQFFRNAWQPSRYQCLDVLFRWCVIIIKIIKSPRYKSNVVIVAGVEVDIEIVLAMARKGWPSRFVCSVLRSHLSKQSSLKSTNWPSYKWPLSLPNCRCRKFWSIVSKWE